ncbi:MAG: ammonia-forming cytochrome c nitrite reductase subunit c552, partial [Rhodospirillales bacterium]|nr:ammonia-forming cytochrome c nitrite reductase subunit c552 [Rhodospirillales bacterium]
TRAYFGSPHHRLWQAELAGAAPPGAGVTCATCHLPRTEERGKFATDHNQNTTLRPNEKMIRPVCLDCHGLGFSLDALADVRLIERNFNGTPAVHVESIEWAVRRSAGTEQGTDR